jgi:hypothetical protein
MDHLEFAAPKAKARSGQFEVLVGTVSTCVHKVRFGSAVASVFFVQRRPDGESIDLDEVFKRPTQKLRWIGAFEHTAPGRIGINHEAGCTGSDRQALREGLHGISEQYRIGRSGTARGRNWAIALVISMPTSGRFQTRFRDRDQALAWAFIEPTANESISHKARFGKAQN